MAKLRKGSFDNLDNLPIEEGQLIFTIDKGNRQIFLDVDDSTRVPMTSRRIEEDDVVILCGGSAPIPEEAE